MIVQAGMRVTHESSPTTFFGTIGGAATYKRQLILVTCFHCVYDTSFKSWTKPQLADHNNTVKIFNKANDAETTGIIEKVLRDDRVDFALIKISAGNAIDSVIADWGNINGIRSIEPGEQDVWVRMVGGVNKSFGKYEGIKPEFGAFYDDEASPHFLTNLIKVRPVGQLSFSEKGDSGSLVLDLDNNIVGAVVMGDDQFSYIMPARILESRLEIKFK
ncbi:hypothetical protein [Chryseolinea sp. H1M3-3]|uniref:hypothetical protein n=1 Tax=Chryseolinea sp. H1M3-3 TaxID=3034144 RepID=UPI0023EB4234|nr:hypothetical protein [Chryseolinea sp. H1M3-3]